MDQDELIRNLVLMFDCGRFIRPGSLVMSLNEKQRAALAELKAKHLDVRPDYAFEIIGEICE